MMDYHRQLHHRYHRHRRLAAHIGIAAVKKQSRRKLNKLFWLAGAGLAIPLFLLAGVLFNVPSNNADSQIVTKTNQTAHVAAPATASTIPPTETTNPTPQPTSAASTPSTPSNPKPAFTTSISIDGDAACQKDTLAALDLLAEKAPSHYATVTKYVGVIKCVVEGSGMEAYLNPPRYLAGDATRNAGTLWYAGTIAHDAGHSKLYNDYLAATPGQSVPADVWTGQNAEAACLNAQYDALQQMNAPQSTLDYIQSSINSGYWNVPYDQRWW